MKPLVILRHPHKGTPIELVVWGDDTATGREMFSVELTPKLAIELAQDLIEAARTEQW